MADAVYFITGENEYSGTTDYQEICYARKLNKPITYCANEKINPHIDNSKQRLENNKMGSDSN